MPAALAPGRFGGKRGVSSLGRQPVISAQHAASRQLHDLRHTAAARMAGDPNLTLVDVQTGQAVELGHELAFQ